MPLAIRQKQRVIINLQSQCFPDAIFNGASPRLVIRIEKTHNPPVYQMPSSRATLAVHDALVDQIDGQLVNFVRNNLVASKYLGHVAGGCQEANVGV